MKFCVSVPLYSMDNYLFTFNYEKDNLFFLIGAIHFVWNICPDMDGGQREWHIHQSPVLR